ncbi:MAG: Rrf2 family transcriptional regulator [Elusimicrobia bacterium]|nr:Rrf2 family transcriptional regulator [Elusimicrobiota bacterium]
MRNMIAITLAAELGMKALLKMPSGDVVRCDEVARLVPCSPAHMSKILQRLAKHSIITPVRGPKGGYRLARPVGDITVTQVIEAVDGRLDAAPEGRELDPVSRLLGRMHNRAVQDLNVRLADL